MRGREEGATTLHAGDDQGIISENGPFPGRLQIPPYFTDPASGDGVSLRGLDDSTTGSTFSPSGRLWSTSSRTRWPIL